MTVTGGMIMTIAAAAGILACLIGLIVTAFVFPRQRKRLLEKIETE